MPPTNDSPNSNTFARSADSSELSHPLNVFFHPSHVAIIGATERPGSPGEALTRNLLALTADGHTSTQLRVSLINPKHASILGVPAYPSIAAVPEPVDLAIIVTPAATVPGVVGECVDAGVRGAIIISAGFREIGQAGKDLERQITERIHGTGMRVIGPNCIGVMNPIAGINATFARKAALPGNVAFISQSGALCTAILDWSLEEALGFSAFVSVGSMLDTGWGDLIDYFGTDPNTDSIVIYMESIGNASRFLEASQEVAQKKPIIVIKAGRTAAAAKAAASHTGALTGSDAVLDAAFQRVGVLRVDSVGDLFHIAEVLSKQPRPKGRKLAIVTNAGGPGVLAADALMAGNGELAPLSSETMRALNAMLPPDWSHGNPIDILADATEATYGRAVELALSDPNSDGVLAITAPLVAARPVIMASHITSAAREKTKPVIAAFMGGSDVAEADIFLSHNGIPTFAFPDDAARVFNYMWRFGENLDLLKTTELETTDAIVTRTSRIIEAARSEGRTLLTEIESKQLLAEYGIAVTETVAAHSPENAIEVARQIGFPVVLKLLSKTITHKSDVGGVKLDLKTEEEVGTAFRAIQSSVSAHAGNAAFEGVSVQKMVPNDGFELILGSSIDPQFGPVLLLGAGGVLAEVMKDTVLELPPLGPKLALRMMEKLRIWPALQGVRGKKPIDVNALESLLIQFSKMVIRERWISEVDINPLLISESGAIALDARILLHPIDTNLGNIPVPAMISATPIETITANV